MLTLSHTLSQLYEIPLISFNPFARGRKMHFEAS